MVKFTQESEPIKALCIIGDCEKSGYILEFLRSKLVQTEKCTSFVKAEQTLANEHWDLVLVDADLDAGDVVHFFKACRERHKILPVVAVHGGAHGTRDTSLIRMGAFDAFPIDMERWNAEAYLDRAVLQAGLVKRLISLSRTDHLTGLFNQRFLYESLNREIRRTRRTSKSLTIALLDLDHFKDYNDTFGHLEGDKALASVAKILAESIREGQDSAYRYGGDEFMLILPDTTMEEAKVLLGRILDSVSSSAPAGLTFSIGMADMASCESIETLINTVDRAMYEAKKAGGNQIVTSVCSE